MSDLSQGKRNFLALDATVLAAKERHEHIKLDVQLNRIRFLFPSGMNTLPLIEECRALKALDDFDLMFDMTMQLIAEKPVHIYLMDYNDKEHLVAKFMVTDRYMDLRGVPFINKYPVVVTWLVDFVSGMLTKKFPRLSEEEMSSMTIEE